MKEAANRSEAPWRSIPLARIGFFSLGVFAVLAIAAIFVPQAQVVLTPVSQQQSLTLPVTASGSITTISLAGGVPAHQITVSVSASQAARVTTQASIPDSKARGIARFTNLSQLALIIPAGTVVSTLSPGTVQFATLNDTHLPGNVNAIVEVPIAAVKGGADANVPVNAIQAIQGSLSLSATVTNPQPTEGGTDRMAAAPSDADRGRLRAVVVDLLKAEAQAQIGDSIADRDLLLMPTMKMGQVAEEAYDPPVGQPGSLLKLTMRADFTADYLKGDDLDQLAEATLNAARPQGFVPVPETMAVNVASDPTVDAAGAVHFRLQLARRLVQEIDLARASTLVRGRSLQQAARILQTAFPLADPPTITLRPPWWPWMPLVPFRVAVTSLP